MSIEFRCPNCNANYTINDRSAGSEIGCRDCGQRIIVPGRTVGPAGGIVYQPIIVERIIERVIVERQAGSPPKTDHMQEFFRRRNSDETAFGCIAIFILVIILLSCFGGSSK